MYASGDAALVTSDAVRRAALGSTLYSRLIPEVDAQLEDLQRLHDGDLPAEHADIGVIAGLWARLRDVLNPAGTTEPRSVLADRLTADFRPLSAHIGQLIVKEQDDAKLDDAQSSSTSATTIQLIAAAIAVGLTTALLLGWRGARRVRRALEPQQDQIEFGDTLQIASDEDEAHLLLQRHLERSLSDSTAVVLNRNNSADRLEAVTPLPKDSPLVDSLRGAEPGSCLAVRSGRKHREDNQNPGLLTCAVCVVQRGNSSCVPLTVGGEVIGSVLLNRQSPYSDVEDQRIRESVSQAAPVLANLRNLAVAEIRAATDSLTGLPNKRAVTDTLKRTFAQASRTGTSLTLILLDLDHFKQINDRNGHPVGDQVLANVGAALRSVLRAGDFAGRNGGEEFALILPDADVAVGVQIAQPVRMSIAEITLPGIDVATTASLGVAEYPAHANSLERLERLAHAALYVAKRSGRNRVEVADAKTESLAILDAGSANGTAEVHAPA